MKWFEPPKIAFQRDFFIARQRGWFLLGLLGLLFLAQPQVARGDEGDYWQFDARGRIQIVLPADINGNGSQELLVAGSDNQLSLLDGAGQPLWVNTTLDGQIEQLLLINQNPETPNDLLVVGLRDALVLLESGSGKQIWRVGLVSAPQVIRAVDVDADGRDEIVVANRLGSLQLFASRDGARLWSYAGVEPVEPNPRDAAPHIEVGDFNGDGRLEIAFAYFSLDEFGYVTLINSAGQLIWRVGVENQVSTLVSALEGELPKPGVIIGTEGGEIIAFDGKAGERLWWRTPNRAITALKIDSMAADPLLIVGTAAGKVLAYDFSGRRQWESILSDAPVQPVRDIIIPPGSIDPDNRIVHYGILISEINAEIESESGKLVFLNEEGRRIIGMPASFLPNVNHLVDLNQDGFHELAIATLGTLSLRELGLGAGTSQAYTNRWISRTGLEPISAVQVTLPEGVFVYLGTATGTLLRINAADGDWEAVGNYPFPIDFLSYLPGFEEGPPLLFVGSNTIERFGGNGSLVVERGTLQAVTTTGEPVWNEPLQFDQHISTILPIDLNRAGQSEMVVGFNKGQLIAISHTGTVFWNTETVLDGRITHIEPIESDPVRVKLAVATDARKIYLLSNKGQDEFNQFGFLEPFHLQYSETIADLFLMEDPLAFLVIGASGNVAVVNNRLEIVQDQEINFARNIAFSLRDEQTILIGFDSGQILKMSLQRETLYQEIWRLAGPSGYRTVLWSDINNDTLTDLVVANDLGEVLLFTESGQQFSSINLPSQVTALFKTDQNEIPQLLTITDNGIVSSFAAQPNRPPLIVDRGVEMEDGRFSFSLTVVDVDKDPVAVSLYIWDERSEEWLLQGEKVAAEGDDALQWRFNPGPFFSSPVSYQYRFDDGVFQGVIAPQPASFEFDNRIFTRFGLAISGIVLLIILLIMLQQFNSPSGWRAWRLYRRLLASPGQTLNLLDAAYASSSRAGDMLLDLANRARRDNRQGLIRLLDGLFLLADRTPAGLEIMNTAFEISKDQPGQWQNGDSWQAMVQTAHELLLAQSITELGLLRPRLLALVKHLQSRALPAVSFEALMRPLGSFRDSSRLNMVEDRLAYLHEAGVLLRQEQALLLERPGTVANTIASAIVNRWLGLTNALIDDLRGRPWLAASLKTKRIVGAEMTQIAIEIENSGQAAAEDVRVVLHESPDFAVVNNEQLSPYLPTRRARVFTFSITPHETSDIRLSFTIFYRDAHRRPHTFEFGDMVRLLSGDRKFKTIPNPYSPGTPLRRESPIFFGREGLLDFIVRTAIRPSQPNIMILVGQRRTGKTSALLRVEKVAPPNLIPIFIDCQSLGIVPGMASFLHDLCWFIADAFERQGIEVEVPELDSWSENPVYYFQRGFLPRVLDLIPDRGRLILIFDEFEALENLVRDKLLPPTLFPFLRHLMQHGDRLNFVFAGTHRLEQMSSEYWSILFNIALYRQVGFLDRQAAIQLIERPVAPLLVYDDLALEKIWRVTAGHPYFLQLVCYTLVNHANKNGKIYITVSDVNVTLKEMLGLGEVHFAYLWQQSSFTEKALLIAASHLHDLTGPLDPLALNTSLEAYDLFLSPQEMTDALESLVERGILQDLREEGVRLYEFRVGLVGQWVVENKSLTELHESVRRAKP